MSDDDLLILMVPASEMVSPVHTVLVRPYAYGQKRIQLTRTDYPDPKAPTGHGSIVREFCTYRGATTLRCVTALMQAHDPEALAKSWERPWNCESPTGRIRLDNIPRDGSPEHWKTVEPSISEQLNKV